MMMTDPFQACLANAFCLGMCSWTGCPGNADMATSKPRPGHEQPPLPSTSNTTLEPHPSSGRFALVSDEELSKLGQGVTPANTAKITNWAVRNFQQWMSNRNKESPTDPVPEDIFLCTDTHTISNNLSKFIVETRKSNGDLYPPATLHQLLCGILRHMRSINP